MTARVENVDDSSRKAAAPVDDGLTSARTDAIEGISSLSKTEDSKPALSGDSLDLGDKDWLSKLSPSDDSAIKRSDRTDIVSQYSDSVLSGGAIQFKTDKLFGTTELKGDNFLTAELPTARQRTARGFGNGLGFAETVDKGNGGRQRNEDPNSFGPDRRDWEKLKEVNSDISTSDVEFYNFDDPGLMSNASEYLDSNLTRTVKLQYSTSIKEISEKLLGPGAQVTDVDALSQKMLRLNNLTDANAVLPVGHELKLISRDRSVSAPKSRSLDPTTKVEPKGDPAIDPKDPKIEPKGEPTVEPKTEPVEPKGDAPKEGTPDKEYTVQKGDNLWKIVKRELGPGASNRDIANRVREIAKANQLRNPDRIYPGQKLKMPGKPGEAPPEKPANPPTKPGPDDPPKEPGKEEPGKDTPPKEPGKEEPGKEEPVKEEPGKDTPPKEPGKEPKTRGDQPGTEPGEGPLEPKEKPTEGPDKPPTSEKERLERNAEKAFAGQPEKLRQFKENMREFEERAKREKLPADEVEKTYKEVSRLLETRGDTPLKESDRVRLADQIVRQAANPRGIDQGQHNTCAINSVEVRTYSSRPSEAAKLVTDVATTGQYTTKDGITVKVDPQPHGESRRPDAPNVRTHASEIFQVTAANINLKHQLNRPNAIPKGDLRYENGEKIPGDKTSGERLMDYSKTPPEYIKNGPNVHTDNIGTLKDTYKSITGDDNKEMVLGHEKKLTDKSDGVKRVKSEAELKEFLEKAKQDGKFPILVSVECSSEPFYSDSGGGSAGGSGGGHVVTIQDYIPGPPPQVTIDNSWGPMADHDARKPITVHDLHGAMQFSRDAVKELQKDVDGARASGKPDHFKEFDILRMERHAQGIDADKEPVKAADADKKYADKLVDAMKRAKEDWDNGRNPEDRERALQKLNQLIRSMDQPHRDRLREEQKKLGLQ